jgi:hypothetical protein
LIYYKRYREYQDEALKANEINHCITNPEDANKIVNLCEQFGISPKGLTVEKLIERLEAEAAEMDYRWRCRTAFLGGAKRNESTNYDFLHADGARDVTKLIFEMADLNPIKMNVSALK